MSVRTSTQRYQRYRIPVLRAAGTGILLAGLLPSPALQARAHLTPVTGQADTLAATVADTLTWQRPFWLVAIDSTAIARLPVRTVEDIIALQATCVERWDERERQPYYRDRGITEYHLAGTREGQTAFTLDGLQLTELACSGLPGGIPLMGVSGIILQTGGSGAGTSNTPGGVVNLITRRGATRWDAEVEIGSSELSGREADDVRDFTGVDGYLGGPLPGHGLTLFLAGSARSGRDLLVHKDGITFDRAVDPDEPASFRPEITYADGAVYDQRGPDGRAIEPLDIHRGWLGYGQRIGWDLLASLTWREEELGTLRLTGLRAQSERLPYTHPWRYAMFAGLPAEIEQNAVLGTPRYDATDPSQIIPGTGVIAWPNERNRRLMNTGRYTLRWSIAPRPDLRAGVRAEYAASGTALQVQRQVNAAGWTPGYDNRYTLTDSLGNPLWTPDDPMTTVTLQPLPFDPGGAHDRRYGYARLQTGSSFTDGSDRWYGDEAQIRRTLRADVHWDPASGRQFSFGCESRWLTFDQYEVSQPWLSPPYITDYRYSPREFSGWLTTRIVRDDLIVSAGLRFDMFKAHGPLLPHWLDPRNPMDTEGNLVIDPSDAETAPIKKAPVRRLLSPRLGLTFPLSERSVVYTSYGHYASPPPWWILFTQGTLEDTLPLIGNPGLEPEKSVIFSCGLRHLLTRNLVMEATFRARDMRNLASAEYVPAFFRGVSNPYDYTIFLNVDTAHIRMFTLRLQRRRQGAWSGHLEYTLLSSEYNRADRWDGYYAQQSLKEMPKRYAPVPWQRTHSFTGLLTVHFGSGEGPRVAGVHPLERLSAGLVVRAASGRPYTPVTSTGEEESYLSGRMPWTVRADLRLSRTITLGGLDCDLFADVRNLFDRRNVLLVYPRTGRTDDPGPEAGNTSDHWDRSHYCETPLIITTGIRIRF